MKRDRRIIKTKKAIREAFVSLLQKYDLNDISVTELAEAADINRKTFYTYYENIHQLVDEIEDEAVSMFADLMVNGGGAKNFINSEEIFSALTQAIRHDYELCQQLLIGNNYSFLSKITAALKTKIKISLDFSDMSEFDVEFMIDYTLAGIISVYQAWFRNGSLVSLDELTEKVSEISLNGMRGLLSES